MLALATLFEIRLVFLYLLITFREATITDGRHDLTKNLASELNLEREAT